MNISCKGEESWEMKKLKRLLASVLGSCMLLTFSAPAFASDSVTAANNTDAEIAKTWD